MKRCTDVVAQLPDAAQAGAGREGRVEVRLVEVQALRRTGPAGRRCARHRPEAGAGVPEDLVAAGGQLPGERQTRSHVTGRRGRTRTGSEPRLPPKTSPAPAHIDAGCSAGASDSRPRARRAARATVRGCSSRTVSSPWSSATARPARSSSRCCAQLAAAGSCVPGRPGLPAGSTASTTASSSCAGGCGIETVPTLLRVEDGVEIGAHRGVDARAVGGADRRRRASGRACPSTGPAAGRCRSTRARGRARGALRRAAAGQPAGRAGRRSRTSIEAMFDRGWTDGLPVVPPTAERVLRMLRGHHPRPRRGRRRRPARPGRVHGREGRRQRGDGRLPARAPAGRAGRASRRPAPRSSRCTACWRRRTSPARSSSSTVRSPGRIGMNSGVNALGQGNRANATIGRALQLVVRNVGGGRPGEVDRATLGNPGKLTFCFAEREEDSPVRPAGRRPRRAGRAHAVTLFAGSGVQPVVDQLSRDPRVAGPHLRRLPARQRAPEAADGLRRDARRVARARSGAPRGRLGPRPAARRARARCSLLPGRRAASAAPAAWPRASPTRSPAVDLPKFRPGGLLVVHAGGDAGLFSAIVGGWVSGDAGSAPVTTRGADMRTRARPHRRADARRSGSCCRARRRCRAAPSACSTSARPAATSSSTGSPSCSPPTARRCGATASRPSPGRRRSTCGTRSPTQCEVVIEALAD